MSPGGHGEVRTTSAGAHRAALHRDARRLADLRRVQDAIERFRLVHGTSPAGDPITTVAGWDASFDGAFLPELVAGGFHDARAHDPREDARFHYVYKRDQGVDHDCAGADGFYVLGIRAFETEVYAARRPGGFPCASEVGADGLAHATGGGLGTGR